MIQIRNVPEALHRELKARAARSGRSLSDFLLVELERIAEKPTVEEVVRRIQSRGGPRDLSPSPTEMIREERSRRWS